MELYPYNYESGLLCFQGFERGPYPVQAYAKSKEKLKFFMERTYRQVSPIRFKPTALKLCFQHIQKGNDKHGYINKKMYKQFKENIVPINEDAILKGAYLAIHILLGLDLFALLQLMQNLRKVMQPFSYDEFVKFQQIYPLLTVILSDRLPQLDYNFTGYEIIKSVTPVISFFQQDRGQQIIYYGDTKIFWKNNKQNAQFYNYLEQLIPEMARYFELPQYKRFATDVVYYLHSLQDQVTFDFSNYYVIPQTQNISDLISIPVKTIDNLMFIEQWLAWFFQVIKNSFTTSKMIGSLRETLLLIYSFRYAFKVVPPQQSPVGPKISDRWILRNLKFQIITQIVSELRTFQRTKTSPAFTPNLMRKYFKLKGLVQKTPNPDPDPNPNPNPIQIQDEDVVIQYEEDEEKIVPRHKSGIVNIFKDKQRKNRNIIKPKRSKILTDRNKIMLKQIQRMNQHAKLTKQIANHIMERQKHEAHAKLMQLRESQITSQNKNLQEQILSIQNQIRQLNAKDQNSQKSIQDLKLKQKKILQQKEQLQLQLQRITQLYEHQTQTLYLEVQRLNKLIEEVIAQRDRFRINSDQYKLLEEIKNGLNRDVQNLTQTNFVQTKMIQEMRQQATNAQNRASNQLKDMQSLLEMRQASLNQANYRLTFLRNNENQIQNYIAQIGQLKRSIEQHIADINLLTNQRQQANQNFNTATLQLEQLRAQIQRLRNQNAEFRRSNTQLQNRQNTLQQQNAKCMDDILNLRAVNLQQETNANNLRKENEQHQRNLRNLQARNAQNQKSKRDYQVAYQNQIQILKQKEDDWLRQMNAQRLNYQHIYAAGLAQQKNKWDRQKSELILLNGDKWNAQRGQLIQQNQNRQRQIQRLKDRQGQFTRQNEDRQRQIQRLKNRQGQFIRQNEDKKRQIQRLKDQYNSVIGKLMGYYFTLHRSQAARIVNIIQQLYRRGKVDKNTAIYSISYCLQNYHAQMSNQEGFINDLSQENDLATEINAAFRDAKNIYIFQANKRTDGQTIQYAQRILNGQALYLLGNPRD